MATHDWNHDGKVDSKDDFMEYQVFSDVMGEENKYSYTPRRSKGISTFGAFVSMIAGFILQAVLYVLLGIDVEKMPDLIIFVVWIVFAGLIAMIGEKKGW